MIRHVEEGISLPESETANGRHAPTGEDSAIENSAIEDSASEDSGESRFKPQLDAYAGPLDLLLYLIHKNEVDILDIPISTILDQYLEHLRWLDANDKLDLFEAGEFLVLAARLMEIKSRLLLPNTGTGEEEEVLEEELIDPRHSLVEQLLEYKEIKERAILLEDVYRRRSLRYERPPEDLPEALPDTLDLGSVSVWDLAAALQRALADAAVRERVAIIEVEDRPIEEVMHEVRTKLTIASGTLSFSELFDPSLGRRGLIGYFLAVLELCKVRILTVEQSDPHGEIQLRLSENDES